MTSQAGTTKATPSCGARRGLIFQTAILNAPEAQSVSTTAATPREELTRYLLSHMGVAACQMEKKGIATEKGELNRAIRKSNRLIKEIRAQIGNLKEWIAGLFAAWETTPRKPQPPKSSEPCKSSDEVFERSEGKEPEVFAELAAPTRSRRTENHITGGELSLRSAVFPTLDELDAALSSVSDEADAIREGMKAAEKRMKELQKADRIRRRITFPSTSPFMPN